MTQILKNLLFVAFVLLITTGMMPTDKNRIIGDYRLVKALNNGNPVPQMTMNRNMSFYDENMFIGDITLPNGNLPYNQGLYYVENDSILIMHNKEMNGTLYPIAFVYKYKISGDTPNIKGFYTREHPTSPNVMIKFTIDEDWVRTNKK